MMGRVKITEYGEVYIVTGEVERDLAGNIVFISNALIEHNGEIIGQGSLNIGPVVCITIEEENDVMPIEFNEPEVEEII